MDGVYGKYLDIDLRSGRISEYVIPEAWYAKYLGGRGVGARILLQELRGTEHPLSDANILVFATGPLQGTGIAGGGRHTVLSLSPNTGSVSESSAGGFLAHELGRSGYDGIIIRGKAEKPAYILVSGGNAQLLDASDLWGKDTSQTEALLQARHRGVRVASIGKAGEKLVRFACIVNDHGRVAGRAGFGAVMGSKNLKAIAVAGHTEKPVFRKDEFKRIARDVAKCLVDAPGLLFGEYGTPSGIMPLNALGILPTKNFQEGTFSEAEKISGDTLHDTILAGRDTCTGCPLRCKRVVKTSFDGREVVGPGPEYETIAAFGSLCLNSDLSSIALANQLCNQHGLDTISTGVTIAFALEAVEKGLLRGLDLRWGDAKGIVRVVELIANREGIGDVLAEGACEAAKKLGADFAQTIKGQEIPLHDPRGKTGLAISYATSPRGGTHVEGLHDTLFTTTPVTPELGVAGKLNRFLLPGKAKVVKAYEDLASFNNSLVMCRLVAYSRVGERYLYPKLRESLLALTGEEFDARRMLAIGERNYILLRIAAAERGYGRREDTLTDRLMSPLPSGPSGGVPIDRSEWMEALREYYEARGYDDNGHPTQEKITALELDLDSVRF